MLLMLIDYEKAVFWNDTDVSEVLTTSETSVNIYQTARRSIPEDSYLHTRCCENLKSCLVDYVEHNSESEVYLNKKYDVLGVDGTSAVVWLFVIIADFCR
jgi:hypothetical protein